MRRILQQPPKRWFLFLVVLATLASLGRGLAGRKVMASSTGPSFIEFESGQVRPLAMSPDGTRLFAVNTPNGTLEVFDLSCADRRHSRRVPVGLEPVAVAARSDTEVWVVNHLSDSVSIVDVWQPARRTWCGRCWSATSRATSCSPGRAGARLHHHRAPRPAAHRSSIANVPGAAIRSSPRRGRPRRRVGVRRRHLGDALGGTPLTIMSFFTDTPRALAVSPDGNTVYVAGFKSGNQTTTINEGAVCDGLHRTAVHAPPTARSARRQSRAGRPTRSASRRRRSG